MSYIDPTGEITAAGAVQVVGAVAGGVAVGVSFLPTTVAAKALFIAAVVVELASAVYYEVADDFPTLRCAGYLYNRCVLHRGSGDGAACDEMWSGVAGIVTGYVIGYAAGRAYSWVRPRLDDAVRAGKPRLDDVVRALKEVARRVDNEVGAIGPGIGAAAAKVFPRIPWANGFQRYKTGWMTVAEHINYRHAAQSGFKNVSKFAKGTTL